MRRVRRSATIWARARAWGATGWPPECDVSIRPGWFYRASEDARVKPAATLVRLYEQSVGRNCLLLLNVPPDTRGLIADPDVTALAGMRRAIDQVYASKSRDRRTRAC